MQGGAGFLPFALETPKNPRHQRRETLRREVRQEKALQGKSPDMHGARPQKRRGSHRQTLPLEMG